MASIIWATDETFFNAPDDLRVVLSMYLKSKATTKSIEIRCLHWAVVAMFMLAIPSGYRMADAGWPGTGILDRDLLFVVHQTAGIVVAFLVLVWALLRVRYGRRHLGFNWRSRATALYHFLLASFGGLIACLGWAGSSAGDYGQYLFGVVPVPNLIPKLTATDVVTLYAIHKALVPYFLAMVGLHISAVLFHAFVMRDGLLQSMLHSDDRIESPPLKTTEQQPDRKLS